jgi:hypothetical protein
VEFNDRGVRQRGPAPRGGNKRGEGPPGRGESAVQVELTVGEKWQQRQLKMWRGVAAARPPLQMGDRGGREGLSSHGRGEKDWGEKVGHSGTAVLY